MGSRGGLEFSRDAGPLLHLSGAALDRLVEAHEEFYTDAQYGADFGYYSTGRILHQPSEEDPSGASFFNSYTTQPMPLGTDLSDL